MQPSHQSVNDTQSGTSHPPATVERDTKLNKIKLALLYVLIGGLVISALISVVAILVGNFNSVIQKALLTTFTLVIHSCLALLIILVDKKNLLGKSLLPTIILAVVIANMITSALGIWEILNPDMSWRMIGLYALLSGAAFIIAGILRLRLNYKPVVLLTYVSVALVGLMTLTLVPWILFSNLWWLSDIYYRLIGAASVLAVTSLVITCIVNRIAVSQKPSLSATSPHIEKYSPGLLAIVIIFGSLVALFWLYGFANLVSTSTYSSRSFNDYSSDDSYYDDSTDDSYNSYDYDLR